MTSLPNVTFKIISYSGHKRVINLKVDFPVVKHNGTYHNNVTLLSTSKHVQDTTNLILDLSSVSITIHTNINNSKVWRLKANFAAKGNVSLSGFLNDEKLSGELSKNLSENLTSILHTHQADISKFISPILEKQINRLYHG
nr:unnamed protein product [Callosobruchus chinensis]